MVRFLQLLDFKSKQAFSFTHYLSSPFLLWCLVLYSEAILEKDASKRFRHFSDEHQGELPWAECSAAAWV